MTKINALKPDKKNANRGTKRGKALLSTSLQNLGAGRSILIDKNYNIIAGNKTLETAGELGIDDIQIVPSDGTKVIAVMRTDLDLYDEHDPRARQLAYADNRVGQVDLEFDPEQIVADLDKGLDLSDYWFEDELVAIIEQVATGLAGEVDGEGGVDKSLIPGDDRYKEQYGVIVVCGSDKEQEKVYEALTSQGYNCKVVVT